MTGGDTGIEHGSAPDWSYLMIPRLGVLLFLVPALGVPQPTYGADRSPHQPLTARERSQGYRDGVVIAKPRAGRNGGNLADEVHPGTRLRRAFARFGNLRILEVSGSVSLEQSIAQLRASGDYEYVEPDYIKHRHALPNDPRFAAGEQWHLYNTGQEGGTAGADIGATAAWDRRTDAAEVIVAVIDTGIRATHEDLVANLWTNPREIPGNGIDDDLNGYVDDVHGINSLAASESPLSGDPDDDSGHGTMIAGLIGAAGNNGIGVAGVAWRVRVMGLKFDDADGSSTTSKMIECLDYAIAQGARIINISYGNYSFSQAEYEALRRARDAGAIVTTSAGNDAIESNMAPHYPAHYLLDNIVTVAATDRNDALSTFSNYGTGLVELAAPGTTIASTACTADDAYDAWSGTSFSSPLVAGTLALLKAEFPSDDYRALINRLLRSIDRVPALATKVQTGGRLNAARALASADSRPFNDDFSERVTISALPVSVRSHTLHATSEPGEPAHASAAPEGTLWWSWTAPESGEAVAETNGSAFDTVLAVYSGSDLAALTSVAASDDTPGGVSSRVSFSAVAGTSYHFAVGGKGGATGAVVLTVGYLPSNDDFADAIRIYGSSLRVAGFNTVATSEEKEPSAAAEARRCSVWYKWTAPSSEYFSLSIFGYGFDAIGGIYTGTSLDALVPVDTASEFLFNEAAVFEAKFGTTYYFQIDSTDGGAGYFDLLVSDAVPIFYGYWPVHPSPAFSPETGYLFCADTYGLLGFVRMTEPFDVQEDVLDGTLEVHSPAIGPDGSMYIGDEIGYGYALNPDLSRRWRNDLGLVKVTSSPAIGADGAVYLHTDDGFLHGFYPDGTPKWRAAVPGESYSSAAIGADGTIYIGSEDGHLYAISPVDGSIKWKFATDGGIYASPAIGRDGILYFGTLGGRFFALGPNGVPQWVYIVGSSISSSAAIGPDGVVYFGAYDRKLYAISRTGSLRWTYATGGEIRGSSPAIASDGTIFIGSYDGHVHAVNSNGTQKRTFATGAYIRSSPLIHDGLLYFGSGDGRLYVMNIGADAASAPWPMHRQNIRRTGRVPSLAAPAFTIAPRAQVDPSGGSMTLAVDGSGADTLTFQWLLNDVPIAGATHSSHVIADAGSCNAGLYTVTITNELGSLTSDPVIFGLATTGKVVGDGAELDPHDIPHPNGNIFDQILLEGPAASFTADAGQITRLSYVDSSDDIVQVEFSGSGTVSIVLEENQEPALPIKYNQAIQYVKGRARIVVTGADEDTNLSVFTVGRLTAFDPTGTFNFLLPVSSTNDPAANGNPLFAGRTATDYDGVADIAFVAIKSDTGKFGGLRTSNSRYSASRGLTGIYAPGIHFAGPVLAGDIDATATATPVFVVGSAAGGSRIAGGDLRQSNNRAVKVSGITRLEFAAGVTSHYQSLPAQANQARLEQDGIDVTAQIVVNPGM